MQCKNCGAQYPARSLRCPYCKTKNLLGQIWLAERTEAEREYEKARAEAERRTPLVVLDRVLNRVLLIGTLLLLVCSVMDPLFLQEAAGRSFAGKKLRREQIADELQTLYQEERLEELYQYMDAQELFGKNYYAYSQAALLGHAAEEMTEHKMALLQEKTAGSAQEKLHLSALIETGREILTRKLGLYAQDCEENQALYEQLSAEVYACWYGLLGMTVEEAAQITEGAVEEQRASILDRLEERRFWADENEVSKSGS